MDNEKLLNNFENIIIEMTKATNGWSRRSEAKLSKQYEKIRKEILEKMKKAT